jgi:hypothetical protein
LNRSLPEITDETLCDLISDREQFHVLMEQFISSQPALYDRLLVLSGGDEGCLANMLSAVALMNAGLRKEIEGRTLCRIGPGKAESA